MKAPVFERIEIYESFKLIPQNLYVFVTTFGKKYGEFNPLSFAAAKFRLKTPSTTALMFASGKIVCTGAPSEDSAHEAIMKYFRMVHSVVPSAVCLDICIEVNLTR
jgi:TATA-box binding protein (TBP) (component of TFIID and TFIIIB)